VRTRTRDHTPRGQPHARAVLWTARATDLNALALCSPDGDDEATGGRVAKRFARRLRAYREAARTRAPWGVQHWSQWQLTPGQERTPRVPHRFMRVPEHEGSSRMVTVQHIAFSPRIRYLHHLLSPEECEHVLKVSKPLFSRSPVSNAPKPAPTPLTRLICPHRLPLPHPRAPPGSSPRRSTAHIPSHRRCAAPSRACAPPRRRCSAAAMTTQLSRASASASRASRATQST
jgi:hypothetical protein